MKEVSDEVWEIAQDLYKDADFNINRYGELESFEVTAYEDYNGYYRDCTEADFEEAKKYLEELLDGVKYYTEYNSYKPYLELSDNHTLWKIEVPDDFTGEFNDEEYSVLYDTAMQHLEEEIGTEVYGLGRSGRHICVEDTFRNLTQLDKFKEAQVKWEQWLINTIEEEMKTGEVTESLNKGEKKARCLSCGADVIYTNRDVEHDIDGDYIECPNCHATFDVDYDAIEPLLNKKTEAEDMLKVKADVKNAVDKSNSTDLEKDQVKGSIDVLKTDEESAIEGYEDFNKETSKVVDKELSDEIDNQMQEIVDDEKEHIEKLDTIKSALGESKKAPSLTGDETYVARNSSGYKSIGLIVDNTNKQFQIINGQVMTTDSKTKKMSKKQIRNKAQQLYDKGYTEYDGYGSVAQGVEKKTEAEDLSYIDSDTNMCKVYYAVNTSGYKSLGLIVNDKDKKFQVVAGQKLSLGSKRAKKSKKQIWDMAKELKANGYEEVRGPSSVAGTVEESKKEELFNNSINLNVDAGDIASNNNLDLGGLGALAGLMASEETKKSDDKLEEATTGAVIRENLNTGVLRIIDVDMYSLNDEIPESATQEGLDEIVQDIAPKYLKEVIQEVLPSVEIYATGVYHPRQYNFSGDELEFDLVANKEEYEALKEKVTSDENFNTYLRNNYKSYDGFISYMADDISEFETQDTWKQVVQVIMFALGDEDNFGPIRNEYLDEFLDRVHTEFGWNDEEDDELDESKKAQSVEDVVDKILNTKSQAEIEEILDYPIDKEDIDIRQALIEVISQMPDEEIDYILGESKKEELFNNTLDVNVNANDISSNNTLDLGGLDDLMGMTEAKVIEAKNKEVNN